MNSSIRPMRQVACLVVSLSLTLSLWPMPAGIANAKVSSQTLETVESKASATYSDIVVFEGLPVALPHHAKLVDGTLMVPGKALLVGLGYTVKWSAAERKATAIHPSGTTFEFWVGQHHATVNGQSVKSIPSAPFIDQQLLWIPLRLVAEASGLTVVWSPLDRIAFVSDPHKLSNLGVAFRTDWEVANEPSTALLDALGDQKGVKLNLFPVPAPQYRDRMNLMIASGDMKELMLLIDHYQYQDEMLASIALDLSNAAARFPALQKLTAPEVGGRTIGTASYGIARPFDPHNAPFPAIRVDWLNILGFEQPRTMDEMHQVLKAFKELDPDGNGKHDTIPLGGYINAGGLGSLTWVEQAYTGSPDRFSVKDGKVIDHAISPEEEQALDWLARAYAEGLIDKEFAVATKEQTARKLQDQKIGAAAMTLTDAAALSSDSKSWLPLSELKAGQAGTPIAPWNTNGNGMYIVSVMAKQPAEDVLKWLDEGIRMTTENKWDSVEGLQESDYAIIQSLFGESDMLQHNANVDQLSPAMRSSYEAAAAAWRKVSYAQAVLPQASSVWSSGKYAVMNDQLLSFKIKVIMGAASLAEWKAYRDKLVSSAEYKSMMDELQQLMA
jgi:putative aldouronate transport system substrate-binding protein